MGAVDQKADAAEQQIRHADHQVDADVIGPGFEEWVLLLVEFLRTGGSRHRVLSGRTGVDRARRTQESQQSEKSQKMGEAIHTVILSLLNCIGEPGTKVPG